MAEFKDRQGRRWEVQFNGAVAVRLKNAGYDLMQAVDPESDFLEKLQRDVVFLVGLLYETCARQCDDRGVSAEQFGELLYAEVLEEAATAVADELVVFSRSRGPLIRKALEKIDLMEKKVQELGIKRLDEIDPDALLQEMLGRYGGDAAGSSGSVART